MYSYHHVYHPLSPSTEGPVGDWMNRVRQVGVSNFPLGGEPLLEANHKGESKLACSVGHTNIGEKKNLN